MPSSESTEQQRPSRLRADKRRAILDAAAHVFMRDGFGLASVDEIVAESGVSKRTLYAHFPGKEALFGAITQEWCDEILIPLREVDIGHRDPRETLIAVGRMFLDVLMSPKGISLYRVVIAEAPRLPELGRIFYEAGHEPAAQVLADYIRQKTEEGVFRDVDARNAAEGFFGLVCSFMHERVLLGIKPHMDPVEVEPYLAFAVDAFLRGLVRTVPAADV